MKVVIENRLLGRLVEFESYYDRYRSFIQFGIWKESAETMPGNYPAFYANLYEALTKGT